MRAGRRGNEGVQDVPAGPEHARLTAMCGTWDVEMTFWLKPGGPGSRRKGTSTIRPLFDGLFIEEKIEGTLNGAPFTTLAWTGFNTVYPPVRGHAHRQHEHHSHRRDRQATTRRPEQFELKADYPMAGDTWHQRTVIQPTSADAMIASSYLSFGQVPEWKGVEIKYARRK